MKRRAFLAGAAGAACSICFGKGQPAYGMGKPLKQHKEPFKISLAQWSLHRRLRGRQQPALDNLDFAQAARQFGIEAIEYVNTFFKDKAGDKKYLAEMKKRAADNGVQSRLIMCDGEGAVGDTDSQKRRQTIENHYKWVDAAKYLGCFAIRVNAYSEGTYDQQAELAADGLRGIGEYAAGQNIVVMVENHGKLSSNPQWLLGVIRQVGMPNVGILPDFGNFPPEIDRYDAVGQFMPYAKAVSAKSYDFDQQGNETKIDYQRMMKIVVAGGYSSYVGIEYEGERLSENDGIAATKRLLERTRRQLYV
ncbi:MAG TPA: sugar phosphate isomerase/epimerase family protein [Sedimentisphaerales bacterium]|nr:sugar phosphate isomerase/epimerase family protein [Sedimentisphaerales bacterium]